MKNMQSDKQPPLFRPDFIQIPYQLVVDRGLEPTDRLLYGVIYWYEHMGRGECIASNQTLAALIFTTTRAIQNSLNALENKGYIERDYKDEAKRNRKRIRAKIAYKFMDIDVRTGGDRRKSSELAVTERANSRSYDERTGGDQIKNRDKRIENKTIAAASAAPFSLQEEIKKLEDNPRRDLNIIALYLDERKPKLESRAQFMVALKRHLRAASMLKPFSDQQIVGAAKKAKAEYPEWTLETLVKLVTK